MPRMMCLNALDTRIHSSWDELQKFMTQTSGGLPYDIDSKLAADPPMTMTNLVGRIGTVFLVEVLVASVYFLNTS